MVQWHGLPSYWEPPAQLRPRTRMAANPSSDPTAPETTIRAAIAVGGVVQGVGFRPFVYNAARRLALVGSVRNDADTVRIEVQGSAEAVDALVRLLRASPPPQARIERIEVAHLALRPDETAFVIVAGTQGSPRPILPADLAACGDVFTKCKRPASAATAIPSRIAPIAARAGRSSNNCRTTARGRRWPGLRCAPIVWPSMRIPATVGFMRNRSPVRRAVRRLRFWTRTELALPWTTMRCDRPPTRFSAAGLLR